VKNERRSVRIAQPVDRRLRDQQARDQLSVRADAQIAEVAHVKALGIAVSMLPRRRVPVRPRAGEARRIAASDRVHVNAMLPRRHARRVDPQHDSRRLAEHADTAQHCAAARHEVRRRHGNVGRRHRHAAGEYHTQSEDRRTQHQLLLPWHYARLAFLFRLATLAK
jgi:hypothetical protein